jgi:hypothetical protein
MKIKKLTHSSILEKYNNNNNNNNNNNSHHKKKIARKIHQDS